MRTIRIRTFTLLCLFLLLLLPWLFFLTAHLIETKSLGFGINDLQKEHLEQTMHLIETNSENWTKPTWQAQLKKQLQEMNMHVSIHSGAGEVIFESTSDRDPSFKQTEQFSIIQDGQIMAKVAIYYSNSRSVQMIAAIVGLLVAFLIIAYIMRRYIHKPLEKMSASARQIAEGDLDVELPVSKITEVAEVHKGFTIMVKGLKASFQKQVELEEERRFVIAAVAHDLRTPLFALRGYLDGLEQGIADTPEKRAKYLAVCKDKSAQLDRLVEDLFTYTKTEYLEMELNEAMVDLPQLLQKSWESVSRLAQQKNISLIMKDLEDDCIIRGDLHVLERAINNLLENAVRYTPYLGKIFIQCYKEGNNVVFTVQDTGEGFSSEDLRRVFEPLYRGEGSRNRSTGGSGLGLTISQRIIRLHGGDLVAGNHAEGGAILTGWLPKI